MKLLYSNILPLRTEEDQETIMDCFTEQMKMADRVEIAVGYTSNACLLYTSPSPRDGLLSRMPSSA